MSPRNSAAILAVLTARAWAAGATVEIEVDRAAYPAGAPIHWNAPLVFLPAGVGAR